MNTTSETKVRLTMEADTSKASRTLQSLGDEAKKFGEKFTSSFDKELQKLIDRSKARGAELGGTLGKTIEEKQKKDRSHLYGSDNSVESQSRRWMEQQVRLLGTTHEELLKELRKASKDGRITGQGSRLLDELERKRIDDKGGKWKANFTELNSAAALVERAFSRITKVLDVFADSSLSKSQKVVAATSGVIESLPVIGDIWSAASKAWKQGLFGDRIRAAEESARDLQTAQQEAGYRTTKETKEQEIERQMRYSRLDARAYRKASFGAFGYNPSAFLESLGDNLRTFMPKRPMYGAFEKGVYREDMGIIDNLQSFGGMLMPVVGNLQGLARRGQALYESQEDPRVLAAKRQAEMARAAVDRPRLEEDYLERQRRLAQSNVDKLRNQEQTKMLEGPKADWGPVTFADALKFQNELMGKQQELQRERNRLEGVLEKQLANRKEIEEKLVGASKAEAEVARTRVSILDEELQKRRGVRESFGLKSDLDQYNLLEGLKQFKALGFDGTPDEVIDMLAGDQITGPYVRERAGKRAADNPLLKQLYEMTDQKTEDALKRERSTIIELTPNFDVRIDDAKLQQKIGEMYQELGDKIRMQLEFIFQGQVNMIQTGMEIFNLSQKQ